MKIEALADWVQDKLKVKVEYMKVWRAKLKALEIIGGNPTASFKLMPKYCDMVKRSNPGSIA